MCMYVRVYSRPVLNRGGIWWMRLLGGRFFAPPPAGGTVLESSYKGAFFGVGQNDPFYRLV